MKPARHSIDFKFHGNLIDIYLREEFTAAPETSIVGHKLTVINHVPILAFEFARSSENFFLYFNFVELMADSKWESNDGAINVKLFFLKNRKVARSISVKFSADDTFEFKRAYALQQGQSAEIIEASIDFIYDKEISEYEWLR